MLKRLITTASAIVLFGTAINCDAALRYNSYLKMCSTGNAQCYGFLMGVVEARSVYIERVNSVRRQQNLSELSPDNRVSPRGWCYPAAYLSSGSHKDFLEMTRRDLNVLLKKKYADYKWDNDTYPFNLATTRQNLLGEALDELFSCEKPDRFTGDPVW